MPDAGKRYRRRSSVVSRTVDGKAVVVVMGGETLHSFNPTGTWLWDAHCKGVFDADRLAHQLAEQFSVDPESARSDAAEFLDSLLEVGAIEEVG